MLNFDHLVEEYPLKAFKPTVQDPCVFSGQICLLLIASKNGYIVVIEVEIGLAIKGVKSDEISMEKVIP